MALLPFPRFDPVYPIQVTAPVAGATAGKYTWASELVAGWVENRTGQTIYIKLHTGVAPNLAPASVTNWDFALDTGNRLPLSAKFKSLSIWFPAAATVQLAEAISGTASGTATVAMGGWPIQSNPQSYTPATI